MLVIRCKILSPKAEEDNCFICNLNRNDLSTQLQINSNSRNIDVGITRLRKKIEENPRKPQFIVNARGKGWLLRGHPVTSR